VAQARTAILVGVLALVLAACDSPTEEESFPPWHQPFMAAQQGGGEGEVVLRWPSADTHVTHWQYRQRIAGDEWSMWVGLAADEFSNWTPWNDVPASDANTTGYRVIGLNVEEVYEFQVRPRTADGPGRAYPRVQGMTPRAAPDGIVYAGYFYHGPSRTLLESGRTFRIPCSDLVFDAPPDVPLGLGFKAGPIRPAVWHVPSGSYVEFYRKTGDIFEQHIAEGFPHVGEVFDELIASFRRVPLAVAPAYCD